MSKRFFMLLYLFLTRHYEKIELVFIRHHTQAQEVSEDDFFHATETGGTVVSSALVLMNDIMRARYPSNEWNIYGAQASDGDNWHQDSGRCRQMLDDQLLPLVRYYAYVQVAEAEQNLWEEYSQLAPPTSQLRDAQGRERAGHLSGVSRPVQEREERPHDETTCFPAAREPLPSPSDWTFDLIETLPRRNRPHRRVLQARHLSRPARDHHRRADDGRLRQRGHAGHLPPLVLRQAVHLHREELPPRPHGPGLRDRHQLRSLHRLPDGGEHDGHAGAGDRARGLRAQQLLQGQLPVPHVDRCVVDHRLPGLRAELRQRVRGAPWRRRRSRSCSTPAMR